jgi:hypothetical protein
VCSIIKLGLLLIYVFEVMFRIPDEVADSSMFMVFLILFREMLGSAFKYFPSHRFFFNVRT